MENTQEVTPEVIENGHRTVGAPVGSVQPEVETVEQNAVENDGHRTAKAPVQAPVEEVVDAPAEGNDTSSDALAEGSEVING